VFFEPNRTQFDLNFRLFGIYVRVHPLFWIVGAMLGWDLMKLGFEYLLLWILCVFVSILLHEMGHVFMGRVFGADSHIVLYSFGGLAVGAANLSNRWQRIAVSLAGPIAQLLFFGLLLILARQDLEVFRREEGHRLARAALGFLLEINLFWPLLNLLPIWPLDGGRVSRDLFDWILPRRGVAVSLGVSLVIAGLLAIHCLAANYGHPLPILGDYLGGDLYMAILFAMLAFGSFQALQALQAQERRWREPAEPWRREDDW
jgi:stage IV sporulation protein FB